MFIKHFQKDKHFSTTGFRYRGLEASRLEYLTDAVFAFAITLLVIASEVPKTYVELQASMYGFIGFIFCILLLLGIWNNHSTFFLMYGLRDTKTKTYNFLFLFVILFYIYPLKYLFSFLGSVILLNLLGSYEYTSEAFELAFQKARLANLSVDQWQDLMIRFGLGLFLIYSIFLLMHLNARKKKEELKLTDREFFETNTIMRSYLALMIISLSSILFVLILGGYYSAQAGCFYLAIPIILPIIRYRRNKKMNSLYPPEGTNDEEE